MHSSVSNLKSSLAARTCRYLRVAHTCQAANYGLSTYTYDSQLFLHFLSYFTSFPVAKNQLHIVTHRTRPRQHKCTSLEMESRVSAMDLYTGDKTTRLQENRVFEFHRFEELPAEIKERIYRFCFAGGAGTTDYWRWLFYTES